MIKVLRYIEAQGHPGFKDKVWRYLREYSDFRNDTTTYVYFPTLDSGDEQEIVDAFELIRTTFDIKEDGMMFEFSW